MRLTSLSLALMSSLSLPVSASELSMTAPSSPIQTTVGTDLASSYIFRGMTFNKAAALQPAIKVSTAGFSMGAWGNQALDPEDNEIEKELDLYASYARSMGMVTLAAGYTEYMYPESEVDNDQEIMAKVALAMPLNPSLGIYHGLEGAIKDSNYMELAAKQELYSQGSFASSLGATLGYLDRPEELKDGLSHLTIQAAATYAVLTASANYIVETDSEVNDLSEQKDFYLSTGASYTF